MKNDNFKFYFPADIEKASDSKGHEVMKFKGIASSPDLDSQSEFLDPSGFDLTGFKFVNWNHLGSKDPSAIIGEPTKSVITKNNELYVEGILFPEMEKAKTAWALMKALQNSSSGSKLGISVEGKVLEKDPTNPNRITKAKITSIALCPVPINGRTWADIMKGEIDSEDEEEYDEETKKAMTAEAGDNVTSKESVEHKEKPAISLESNKILKKSDVYEQIHNTFPTIDIEKAKSVYSLIEKIATMESQEKTIKDETISKAFEILNLASEELSKGAKPDMKKNDEVEEDEDEKEMVTKAGAKCKVMKSEGKTNDEMKATLLKKGFGEKIIEKAISLTSTDSSIEKSEEIVGLSKEDVAEIVKSELNSFNEKFAAVNTILKSQLEANDDLKKSLEVISTENGDLKAKIETISKSSNGPKSVITKSYTEKGSFEKSEGDKTGPIYNLKSQADRKALKELITEKSGINKGEKFDQGLIDIAQELELTGSLHKSSDIRKLQSMGFNLVAE